MKVWNLRHKSIFVLYDSDSRSGGGKISFSSGKIRIFGENIHLWVADAIPGTQSEVIKPLERTVENLSMTSLILNRLGGVG